MDWPPPNFSADRMGVSRQINDSHEMKEMNIGFRFFFFGESKKKCYKRYIPYFEEFFTQIECSQEPYVNLHTTTSKTLQSYFIWG